MELANLRKMKRPELIEIAAHFKMKKRHRMRKRDLVKALEKRLAEIPAKFSAAHQKPRTVETSSRFAPTPPPPQPAFVDRGAPIPLHYGQDRVTLLVRDPNSLFVFWELEGPRQEEIARTYGGDIFRRGSWVVRIHNDVDSAPQDIPVVLDGCNWYLSVADDRGYVVEIGVTMDGRFTALARSNHVRTPRTGVSPDTTTEWMLVEEDFRKVVRLSAAEAPKMGGKFAEALAERFRVPNMGTRFLGASEKLGASGRVPGSAHMKPAKQ